LAAAGLAPAAAAQEPDPRASFHGAASMADQLAALDKLGLPAEGVTPPKGVDPEIWTASIVPGQEPTSQRVALGRTLYFDTRLSADGTVSCATCHDSTRAFTDQRMVSEGIGGQLGRRNAPTTLNASLLVEQFWDGRATTVEHQAGMPILNPIEMGEQTEEQVVARLAAVPAYQKAFELAWGRPVNYADLRASIGAFERTLVFLDSPFDRFRAGDQEAISPSARRGWTLFDGKARCANCHPLNASQPLGTDHAYHNIGVAAHDQDFEGLAAQALKALEADSSEHALDELALSTDMSELGRFMVTRNRADIGAFKTEQLRNIGITAPYMHDGSMQTLWDVIDHYNKGGEDNPFLDGGIEALALTESEIDDLVAALFTLTDDRFVGPNGQAFEAQRARAAETRSFRDDELAQRKVLGFERRVTQGQTGGDGR
ncbi:MAG TPA: cytochrome c peroxidase, partial [Planctomycetota bacterium]|nr:cytochrome c peroxidase [Planctomycetota bacterium]